MKVIRPTQNQITRGYSDFHRAYDFAGLNLPNEVRAGMDGVIIEKIDQYSTNWQTTDPFLTVKDYGNYIKIRHNDGSFELHAHLEKGSSLNQGTRVSASQVIARIGNTGNSTGKHLHSEYRTAGNINTPVEFTDVISSPTPMDTQKAAQLDRIKDFLKSKGWPLSDNPAEYGEKAVLDAVVQIWTDREIDRPKAEKFDKGEYTTKETYKKEFILKVEEYLKSL